MRAIVNMSATGLILIILLLSYGCGYQIQYALNSEEIVTSKRPVPMKVQATRFADARDPVERDKDARDQRGDSDLADFTYDSEFQGDVAVEITRMLVEHLNFSKTFTSAVRIAPGRNRIMTDAILDSLHRAGIDGVLTGDVIHFYGYYDQNIGRKLLYAVPLGVASGLLLNWTFTTEEGQYMVYWYGPGLVAGYYLESLHARRIERHTQLVAKLTSTSTHQTIWEGVFDVVSAGEEAMPGINTEQRKFEVVVASLREAVNMMVKDLSANSDAIMQRKDLAGVQLEKSERPAETRQRMPVIPEAMREMGLRFGVTGGVNLATITGFPDGGEKTLIGFAAGARAAYRFNDMFAVRTEIAYSIKGSKYSSSIPLMGASIGYVDGKQSLSYLDVPLLAEFYPTEDIKLLVGPNVSFFLGGSYDDDVRIEGPSPTSMNYSGDLTTDDVKGTDVGLLLGAGYSFGAVDIEARYGLALTNNSQSADSNLKNHVIQILVGFNF